jgi:hypothetical protein
MNWKSVNTPKKVMRLWNKGMLGSGEFRSMLLQTCTPENAAQFRKFVPRDIAEELKRIVEQTPLTEREGPGSRVFYLHGHCGPWDEEIEARRAAEEREASERYRVGVHTFRTYFSCIFGQAEVSPQLSSMCLRWNGGTIHMMARQIHASGTLELLPLLADALEDGGCTSTELLTHLRARGPHVRGCYALDLLLGK